jgi:hypothetical protein
MSRFATCWPPLQPKTRPRRSKRRVSKRDLNWCFDVVGASAVEVCGLTAQDCVVGSAGWRSSKPQKVGIMSLGWWKPE